MWSNFLLRNLIGVADQTNLQQGLTFRDASSFFVQEKQVLLQQGTNSSEIEAILSISELDPLKEDKNILQVAKLNQLAYKKLILSLDQKSASGKAAFGMVKNCKMSEYLEWHGIEFLQIMLQKRPYLYWSSKRNLKIASSKILKKIWKNVSVI